MPEAINAPALLVVPAAAGTPAVASATPGAGGLFGGFLAAALSVGGALAQGTRADPATSEGATPSPLLAGVSAALLADTPDEEETAAEPGSAVPQAAATAPVIALAGTDTPTVTPGVAATVAAAFALQADAVTQDAGPPATAETGGDEAAPDPQAVAARAADAAARPAQPSPGTQPTGVPAAGPDPDPAAAAVTTVAALAAASQDAVGDPLVDALIDMVTTAKVTAQRDMPAEAILRDAAVREAAERAPASRPQEDAVEVARRAEAPARPVEDAASAVARSTVTRDTAGTALAAAILGADPAMRPAASRSTRPAERADATAATLAGSASTPSTGGATVPPPSPGGLAAAATAFAARIKALGGERTDSPTAGAASGSGSGTGGLPSGALSASSVLPGAQALAQASGQAGTTAGATQAGLTGVLPQIAAEITRRAAAGETRFQIRLDPVELGRIDVRLSLDDAGEARAHLTVERRETYELIARDQRGLERTLREAGYEVRDGSVQVTLRQNAEGGSGGGGAFERFAQQHQQQHGQNPHSGGQRGGDPSAGPVPNTQDATEADMLARLAAFASRPAGIAGRVDIRL
jgi:flagellar hook-length control protein FliK